VRVGADSYLAGWLQETDDYIEYVQADEAIAQAITNDWFALERQDIFSFTFHAETIDALADYLDETSEDAILDDMIIMRAHDLMLSGEPDKEVTMRVPVSISQLRPLPRHDDLAPEAS
jgi:hypothetical protein